MPDATPSAGFLHPPPLCGLGLSHIASAGSALHCTATLHQRPIGNQGAYRGVRKVFSFAPPKPSVLPLPQCCLCLHATGWGGYDWAARFSKVQRIMGSMQCQHSPVLSPLPPAQCSLPAPETPGVQLALS